MNDAAPSDILTVEQWLELTKTDHSPADEEVVLIRKLKEPYTLVIPKNDLARCFPGCGGIELAVGADIGVVGSETGGRSVALTDLVIRQFHLTPKPVGCVGTHLPLKWESFGGQVLLNPVRR